MPSKTGNMLGSVTNEIEAVLDKKVSRKGFLQHVGVAALGVLGVQSLLSSVLHSSGQKKKPTSLQSDQGGGYGNSRYGV